MLDRQQLEAIVLDPSRLDHESLRADSAQSIAPSGETQRDRRLRHVLEAAHELLVRVAHEALIGRCLADSPKLVRQYLRVLFAGAERELFVTIFLDTQLRVIAAETMFEGTLSQTSVYPREVVRRALYHNAAEVVLAHNHPSGVAEPSRADEFLTQTLQRALALIDVRVVDHIVVGSNCTMSFAEAGRL